MINIRKPISKFTGWILITSITILTFGHAVELPLLVPRMDEITIDGISQDWLNRGFKIPYLLDQFGQAPATSDFKVKFRLGWDDYGLLLLLDVTDDKNWEHEELDQLWRADCVELFLAPERGASERVQFILSPGWGTPEESSRLRKYDKRIHTNSDGQSPQLEYAVLPHRSGYTLEARLPLDQVGITAATEQTVAFQLYVRDSDRADDPDHLLLPWYIQTGSHENSYAMYTLRLSLAADISRQIQLRPFWEDDTHLSGIVYAEHLSAPQTLKVEYQGVSVISFSLPYQTEPYIGRFTLAAEKLTDLSAPLVIYVNDLPYEVFEPDLLPVAWINIEPARFESEIRQFEFLDRRYPPNVGGILFVGSSSFRMWNTMETDLAPLPVINRGFGGSTMANLNHFRERVVAPYKPDLVVIYEGDNDLTGGTTPDQFLENCAEFRQWLAAELPGTNICFLSIKPSPARIKHWTNMQIANAMLSKWAAEIPGVYYLDVASALLKDGAIDEALFLNDGIHLNAAGYEQWTRLIRPVITNLTGNRK